LARGIAGKTIFVGNGEPPLGGLAQVGADFVECFSLGVTARKCGDGGRIAAGVGFRADNRREMNGNIDDNG
jgi:hypothetical protein